MFLFTSHTDGKGGVVIGIAPWIAKHIIDKGEDPSHSCVWVLTFINGQLIGFCSIYALNFAKECIVLWIWLANKLPNAEWIIGGDFNMVEHAYNHSWSKDFNLSREEFDSWLFWWNSLGVVDPIHEKKIIHSHN